MPKYAYKVMNSDNNLVEGVIDAADKKEVIDELRKSEYVIVEVIEDSSGVKIGSLFEQLRGVKADDLVLFNIRLSSMLNSGIPLLNSLNTLTKQTENKVLRGTVESVVTNIKDGEKFSDALAHYPKIFSGVFINMVKAGEVSGELGVILERFVDYSERQIKLKEDLKMVVFYPLILIFVVLVVTLFLVTFIIPKFVGMFQDLGISLPLSTIVLYKVGTSIVNFWYVFLVLPFFGWLAGKFYNNTETGRFNLDKLKWRLPLIGPLYRRIILSRFARILATLISSGVPILESLTIVEDVLGNKFIGKELVDVRESIRDGQGIAKSLSVSKEFPSDVIEMISTGETSGNLVDMLNKASDLSDRTLTHAIKKFIIILEPMLLIIVGGIVAFIMASMLIPVFNMSQISF